MKTRFATAAAIFGLLIFSCSPKTTNPTTAKPVSEKTPAELAHDNEVAAGQSMYENNCAKCHKLFSPTDFNQAEWAPILVRMQRKAKLDDMQIASITTYINSQAK